MVNKYQDVNGIDHYDIPEHYKSNCHGSALGLDIWINDIYDPDLRDVNVLEDLSFQNMMNSFTSTASDANFLSFYNGSILAHSIKLDPSTGEIWSKSDHGEMSHYDSLDSFFSAKSNSILYESLIRKYYKI